MRTRFVKLSLLVIGLGLVVALVPGRSVPSRTTEHSTGLAKPEMLLAAYESWARAHEAAGGDRRVVVALNAVPGLVQGYSRGSGLATLDLVGGSVDVSVDGEVGDVWLVDNRPGQDRTIAPEPGDRMLRAGALHVEDGRARLKVELGAQAFASFDPDLVVVTPAGVSPTERRVLAGMTTLFQRLHRTGRDGQSGVLADAEEQVADETLLARLAEALQPSAQAALGPIPNPTTPLELLITAGRQSFLNETFQGNGRTCATCHREAENMTISPEFISTLPPNDPLFVAEFNPDLAANFENPVLMRKFGLILENVDGLDDLPNKFVMRGVPHTLALIPNTLKPAVIDGTTQPPNERTGWSGDGAPGTGTLREFLVGAITQHYPKTLGRVPGVDFRLPTVAELDAVEAFQKSLGRQADIKLAGPNALRLKSEVAKRGQEIFNNPGVLPPPLPSGPAEGAGKCLLCHFNAGAGDFVESVILGGPSDPGQATELGTVVANANFDTGVEDLPSQPADLVQPPQPNPPDGGFGQAPLVRNGVFLGFGDRTFNTPVLVEAADTGPFFHNNAIDTIEGAVAFYNGDSFNNTALAQGIGGINLDATEIVSLAAFLRAINTLENIRSSIDLETRAKNAVSFSQAQELIKLSLAELEDAIEVLDGGNLHPEAQKKLVAAAGIDALALVTPTQGLRNALLNQALALKASARSDVAF